MLIHHLWQFMGAPSRVVYRIVCRAVLVQFSCLAYVCHIPLDAACSDCTLPLGVIDSRFPGPKGILPAGRRLLAFSMLCAFCMHVLHGKLYCLPKCLCMYMGAIHVDAALMQAGSKSGSQIQVTAILMLMRHQITDDRQLRILTADSFLCAAGHECDPDICRGCAATCEQGVQANRPCHNMRLRLRQHKRVAMGLSRVAGWGAFLQVGSLILA